MKENPSSGMRESPVKIALSVLAADFARLGEEARRAEEAGADMLHFDLMDGHFVPNLSFGPMIVKALRKHTSLPFYAHLMVYNPENYIRELVEAGSEIITVHAEACVHLHRAIRSIKREGVKAGVALNPATPLTSIKYVLSDLDLVLVMTVNPGFGGQEFIPGMLGKVREMRKILVEEKVDAYLAVDGGITPENAAEVVKAGADLLVAGTATFGRSDLRKAVEELRREAERGYAEKWW